MLGSVEQEEEDADPDQEEGDGKAVRKVKGSFAQITKAATLRPQKSLPSNHRGDHDPFMRRCLKEKEMRSSQSFPIMSDATGKRGKK